MSERIKVLKTYKIFIDGKFPRTGRSGHRPNDISKIYFLPTHAIELLECNALKKAPFLFII